MKSMIKLLVFVLLMQHGVANASWISEELLGAKQARIVHDLKNPARLDNLLCIADQARVYVEFQESDCKDQEAYDKKIKNIKENFDQQYVKDKYNNAICDAAYLGERRDFIRHFGTLGLDCLSLSKSEKETRYQDFKAGFYTKKCNFVVDTNICHDAILQFDLEQRVYQNRIIAVGSIVAAVAFVVGIMEGMNK
ncbi:MAG: hypothetical protein Q8Q60_00245 [Candidatus Chromulinivorax sp.]|nr:hypothetical protein [Candidatus Chromulinivorax sp.]